MPLDRGELERSCTECAAAYNTVRSVPPWARTGPAALGEQYILGMLQWDTASLLGGGYTVVL